MKLKINFLEVNPILQVNFVQTECQFNIDFSSTNCSFKTDFNEKILVKLEDTYEGPYNVIPRVYTQTLQTQDKILTKNVEVEIIPLVKVTNHSNGYTAIIG